MDLKNSQARVKKSTFCMLSWQHCCLSIWLVRTTKKSSPNSIKQNKKTGITFLILRRGALSNVVPPTLHLSQYQVAACLVDRVDRHYLVWSGRSGWSGWSGWSGRSIWSDRPGWSSWSGWSGWWGCASFLGAAPLPFPSWSGQLSLSSEIGWRTGPSEGPTSALIELQANNLSKNQVAGVTGGAEGG